jgi:predicted nicotinamide N-methyase
MTSPPRTSAGSSGQARPSNNPPTELRTTAGDVPLHEYHVTLGGHAYTILHTGAVLTFLDEQILLSERETRLPYGVALWPSAIALAHEIAARTTDARDRRVLELGAGTGLPGIVAASLGAHVVQTDRQQAALSLCRLNAERNGVGTVQHRLADWAAWTDTTLYDWIIGADILYAGAMHPHLTRIFASNLAPGGRVLLSDPFRRASLAFLESLEAAGWTITVDRWSVGEQTEPSPVGVYELTRKGPNRHR